MRNRLYAGINIGGLAVGLAVAILIALYIRDELTFDRFVPEYQRTYRFSMDMDKVHLDAAPSRPNTHLTGQIFAAGHAALSRLGKQDRQPSGQLSFDSFVYLRLKADVAMGPLIAALSTLPERFGLFNEQFRVRLINIADIHFEAAGVDAMKPAGDLATLRASAAIGALVLLAACINFVNLMTARASRRAIEVGVRKALSARRRDLIAQFIGESILYVTIATILAVAMVELLIPTFNSFLDRQITFEYWHDPVLLATLVTLALIVGVAAGSYPALVLSGFRPANVLQGHREGALSAQAVRHSLVIVQFGVLMGLLIATEVIYRQTLFALQETVRGPTDEILILRTSCRNRFENEVRSMPGVRSATCANELPRALERSGVLYRKDGASAPELYYATVDFDYDEFYGLTMRAGRWFSKDHAGDIAPAENSDSDAREAVVVNETAARTLGFKSPQQAIGQSRPISMYGRTVEIIGVVADFPMGTVRRAIPPPVLHMAPAEFSTLHVKLIGARIPETVAAIERSWRAFGGARTLRRSFLNEFLETEYREPTRQSSIVALFIGCLGLFGLSVFNIERRAKEIGVRKAIVRMMTWQFIKPALWANLIAWPLSAWLMQRWLEGFALRIDLQPGFFLAASGLALIVATLTVAAHCYLAASTKPVTSLRYQ